MAKNTFTMKPNDAAKLLDLDGDITPETVKLAYRRACKKYHPDINPAGLEMMKSVNLAYEALKDFTGNVEQGATGYSDSLNDALNAVINLVGLNIEICGAWVWISGDTKTHKTILKESGYKWASKKKMWYFRPEDYKSANRGTWSIDKIRDSYGSQTVRGSFNNRIQGA